MIKPYFNAIITGAVLGMSALVVTWLLWGGSSPFREYFLSNVGLPNLWRMLNLPVLLVVLISKTGSLAIYVLLSFLQWFILGFLGNLAVRFLLETGTDVSEKDSERIPPSRRVR